MQIISNRPAKSMMKSHCGLWIRLLFFLFHEIFKNAGKNPFLGKPKGGAQEHVPGIRAD
jgi:hypothetical protein